jgi:hypothetical protein
MQRRMKYGGKKLIIIINYHQVEGKKSEIQCIIMDTTQTPVSQPSIESTTLLIFEDNY